MGTPKNELNKTQNEQLWKQGLDAVKTLRWGLGQLNNILGGGPPTTDPLIASPFIGWVFPLRRVGSPAPADSTLRLFFPQKQWNDLIIPVNLKYSPSSFIDLLRIVRYTTISLTTPLGAENWPNQLTLNSDGRIVPIDEKKNFIWNRASYSVNIRDGLQIGATYLRIDPLKIGVGSIASSVTVRAGATQLFFPENSKRWFTADAYFAQGYSGTDDQFKKMGFANGAKAIQSLSNLVFLYQQPLLDARLTTLFEAGQKQPQNNTQWWDMAADAAGQTLNLLGAPRRLVWNTTFTIGASSRSMWFPTGRH
jgi:hypothetical protein